MRIRVVADPPGAGPGHSPNQLVGRVLTEELQANGHEVAEDAEAMFLAGATPQTVRPLVTAAVAAGVRRVVVLSSHGPEFEIEHPPQTWFWLAIERAVEELAPEWTHIRPAAVMGSMLAGGYPATGVGWLESIRAEGVVREPRGYYPFIAERDLAAVAAAALLKPGYTGKILEAVGPPISTQERVDAIARALGRPIRIEGIGEEEARKLWREQGVDEDAITVTLYGLAEYSGRTDFYREWTASQRPTVEEIIGRPLTSYADWAADNLSADTVPS